MARALPELVPVVPLRWPERVVMEDVVFEQTVERETRPRMADLADWSEASLIAAVREEPPNEQALDVLVERHWKPLYARCEMLTLDRHKAFDLAQDAWRRILRARRTLKPDGNLGGYLNMTATNLWRDKLRSARRAGPLAENRMLSLDAPSPGEDGESIGLAEAIPDLNSLDEDGKTRLRLDIDRALSQLTPLLRDVLVSRYVMGESCAEMGRRYRRTEQTVSGWVREAARIMRTHLADAVPAQNQSID